MSNITTTKQPPWLTKDVLTVPGIGFGIFRQ